MKKAYNALHGGKCLINPKLNSLHFHVVFAYKLVEVTVKISIMFSI